MSVAAVDQVTDRLADVRRRIAAAGGDPDRVAVVAVTKGHGPAVVDVARRAGLRHLGENYAQELEAKAASPEASASPPPVWHFLGAPQRNKMARLAPIVALWQGVDRPEVIDRLARVAPGASLLVQVDVVGRPGRAGCPPEEAPALLGRARDAGLDVRGVMCVGPPDDPEAARSCFSRLATIGRDNGVDELSMGMSDDFEAAVAAGSTMVRLGRILFGPRPGPGAVRR